MTIAILSAMPEECSSLIECMCNAEQTKIARRVFYKGQLWDRDVVLVFSRWGKVAAASTTVVLIREFGAKEIIFTGVAGAINPELKVGDVVIGNKLYQHDIDARPMLAQYEIPLLGIVDIESDPGRREQIEAAASTFVTEQLFSSISKSSILEFNIDMPNVVIAGIATGDQFISNESQAAQLRENLPDVACVEMEGGAVAQICNEYDIPFSVIRTISDSANAEAGLDFPKFVANVASEYSLGIMKCLFEIMDNNDRGAPWMGCILD